jgi:hypothetical protein
MFCLTSHDLSKGVLDCGGGPASFTAELSYAGFRAALEAALTFMFRSASPNGANIKCTDARLHSVLPLCLGFIPTGPALLTRAPTMINFPP